MNPAIVQSTEIITLLGAAPVSDTVLHESLALGPTLVAADGGARRAIEAGLIPQAIIGDLDSLGSDVLASIPADRMHRIDEQDSTDFDKALRHIQAPLVLAVGFTGARLDHELAVYNALVRMADRPTLVFGGHDICFHAPALLRLALPVRTRVSLFPMAAVTGRSTGLRWPIEGLAFAPHGRVGTSNEASADRVTLTMDGPGMLVILPRPMLRAAILALVPG